VGRVGGTPVPSVTRFFQDATDPDQPTFGIVALRSVDGVEYHKIRSATDPDVYIEIDGSIDLHSRGGGGMDIEADGGMDIDASGGMNIRAGGGLLIDAGGGLSIAADGTLDIRGLGGLVIDGAEDDAPGPPGAGRRRLYPKADGWYDMDEAGVEVGPFGPGGGGAYLTFCRKTADETVNLMTATPSANMALPVEANKVYRFRFVLHYDTNAASVGIRLGVSVPAGATVRWGALVPNGAPSGTDVTLLAVSLSAGTLGALANTGPGTVDQYAVIEGIAVIGATAGDVQLLHASETATDTTILANSYGELVEIA
jgi:hypothetical protein